MAVDSGQILAILGLPGADFLMSVLTVKKIFKICAINTNLGVLCPNEPFLSCFWSFWKD